MNISDEGQRLTRAALAALCIGATAMAVGAVPFGSVALAKNSGDHGGGRGADHSGDHGGGNGGGGNGNANGHSADQGSGQERGAGGSAGAGGADAGSDSSDDGDGSTAAGDGDQSLSAHGLGKLNGFFHASPTALANAAPNSSIGRLSHAFADALSAYAAHQQTETDGTGTGSDGPTADDLGAILADATNKPVTAAQVHAIAQRLASLDPEDTALGDFAANADAADDQKIADAANAARAHDAEGDAPETTAASQ
jgi:hypothetical protein